MSSLASSTRAPPPSARKRASVDLPSPDSPANATIPCSSRTALACRHHVLRSAHARMRGAPSSAITRSSLSVGECRRRQATRSPPGATAKSPMPSKRRKYRSPATRQVMDTCVFPIHTGLSKSVCTSVSKSAPPAPGSSPRASAAGHSTPVSHRTVRSASRMRNGSSQGVRRSVNICCPAMWYTRHRIAAPGRDGACARTVTGPSRPGDCVWLCSGSIMGIALDSDSVPRVHGQRGLQGKGRTRQTAPPASQRKSGNHRLPDG